MKKVLKFGSIITLLFGLVFLGVFFFAFLKGFARIELIKDASGFSKFINDTFYPVGFAILFIVFIFISAVSVLFLFDDDKNLGIASTQVAASGLLVIWFIIATVKGKSYFDEQLNGKGSTTGRIAQLELSKNTLDKSQADLNSKESAIVDAGGSIDEIVSIGEVVKQENDLNTQLKNQKAYIANNPASITKENGKIEGYEALIADAKLKLETETDSEQIKSLNNTININTANIESSKSKIAKYQKQIDEAPANIESLEKQLAELPLTQEDKDYYNTFSSYYDNYVDALNKYNSDYEVWKGDDKFVNRLQTTDKAILPCLLLSIIPLLGSVAELCWVIFDKENFE